MRKIRKGDRVQVISGKEKGRVSTVLKVLTRPQHSQKELWLVVEGVNLKKEYVKANPQKDERGGIRSREAPLPACKVALFDPVAKKPSRIGICVLENGERQRYFKSSGEGVVENG